MVLSLFSNRGIFIFGIKEDFRMAEKKETKKIPILGFSGYSNSGKTTLIEKLIVVLKQSGLRIAVIKHHGHDEFEIDKEGKDSWKFTQAGADVSIIASPKKTAYVEQRPLEFQQLVSMVQDVDLILVEGFKRETIPQIGVCREITGNDFPTDISRYIAVVTDKKDMLETVPKFNFEEIELLSGFILRKLREGSLSKDKWI